jgi:hypothetical protein
MLPGSTMRHSVLVSLLALAGCTDLSSFTGAWHGRPLASPSVLVGLPATTQIDLELTHVDRAQLAGSLAVGGPRSPLRPLPQAQADSLAELSLPDSPLRTFLEAAALTDGDALVLVSLYGEDRVDLRLIRADTLYAVARLAR